MPVILPAAPIALVGTASVAGVQPPRGGVAMFGFALVGPA